MIKMKALRSWTGQEGQINAGQEFSAASEYRAKDLEAHGLAHRLQVAQPKPTPLTTIGSTPENVAAAKGPLALAGGETGEAKPAPSSPPARQRRKRTSRASKNADLLS